MFGYCLLVPGSRVFPAYGPPHPYGTGHTHFSAGSSRATPTLAPQEDSWQKISRQACGAPDYPPLNQNFELDGFDIALIQQIGQRLGLQVELNDFAFDGLPMTVAIGQVDVAIGALSVSPEREAVANFSNVYFSGSDAVLSRPEADPQKVKDASALAVTRLGVQVNSIYEIYAQQKLVDAGLMPKQNLYVYTDISQAVNDLKAKRIDAVWLTCYPLRSLLNQGSRSSSGLEQQPYAIGMIKCHMRDKINEALALQNDGIGKPAGAVPGYRARKVIRRSPCLQAADAAEWLASLMTINT
jgi:ABC-type amino acid transport substrate-binding protein